MTDSSDALAELLTLTLTVDQWGDRIYRNSQGLRHRVHGPAIEWADGDQYWCLNDQIHRTDGPAIEWANGDKSWYLNNKLHRTDGPAIEWPDGTRVWYLDGQQLSEKEFNERLK